MATTTYFDSLGNELYPLIIDSNNIYFNFDDRKTGFCFANVYIKDNISQSIYKDIVSNTKAIETITIPFSHSANKLTYNLDLSNIPVAKTEDDTIITNSIHGTISHKNKYYYFEGELTGSNNINTNTDTSNVNYQGSAYTVSFLVLKVFGTICFDTNNNYLGICYMLICYNIRDNGSTSDYEILGSGVGFGQFGGKKAVWNGMQIYPLDYASKDLDNTNNTEVGGGYGSGTNPHDTIEIPQLPNLVLSNTGSSLYALNASEMQAFSAWLWTSDWTENIKKLRTDSMQNIIGISIVDIPMSGKASTIYLGNINSGVNAQLVDNWVSVDCGIINVEEYYGTFADYEPYIALTLYLPKVGFVQIPADAVVNNSIKVVYNIELSSGEGLCYVYIVNNRDNFSYVYNTYTCHVSANVALSASDHTQQISAIINASINTVTAVGGAIATGGATAGSAATTVASSALNVATTKNPTQTKGNFGNFGTLMCVKKPYLIINRTNLTKPSSFQENNGYMINYTAIIGGHTGFLQTRDYHCKFNAPYNHRAEIENLLNGGVIIND